MQEFQSNIDKDDRRCSHILLDDEVSMWNLAGFCEIAEMASNGRSMMKEVRNLTPMKMMFSNLHRRWRHPIGLAAEN